MKGLMQERPLLVHTILDHARAIHGRQEIVSRSVEGPIHRQTYADLHLRSRKVSQALRRLGIGNGDVVATMAWNTWRHLEAWYAIAGVGGVYHTLNPRLFPEQIAYIVNHADDKLILADLTFLPLLQKMQDKLPGVRGYVVLTDREHMPETSLKNAHCYEDLLAAEDGDFNWEQLDENDACGLCYTSGTTGNPKGVLYSHRSNVLHAMAVNASHGMGMRSVDTIMPVVPLFHANAWSVTFSAPMAGAKLVLPGLRMDGEGIYQLIEEEKVNLTAAVPTIWLMLLQYLEKSGKMLPTLERVVIGGAAVPRVIIEAFEKKYGVEVIHAWGMTETSPLGTMSPQMPKGSHFSDEELMAFKLKQGQPPYTVEMKIVNDDGEDLPWDGKISGHLMVRGPAVSSGYMKGEGSDSFTADQWFDTGDIASIDENGLMQITDRSKDVIKSGGEWISSIELENIAVGHPDVAEAAVIGLPHPKWDERPLLIIAPVKGASPDSAGILKFMEGKIAKWWMPDDVVFVDEIPHTATGKIQKNQLREQFKGHRLPTVTG